MGLTTGLAALTRFLDGSTAAGQTAPLYLVFAAAVILPWGVGYYVARAARAALAEYRRALGDLSARYDDLERRLTSMPIWASILAPLIGIAVWAVGQAQLSSSGGWGVSENTSTSTNISTYIMGIIFNTGFIMLVFRVIEQTRLIAIIHRLSTGVDIWQTVPHRAFSRLTLPIAATIVFPYAVFQLVSTWDTGSTVSEIVVLVAAFTA